MPMPRTVIILDTMAASTGIMIQYTPIVEKVKKMMVITYAPRI